MADRIERIAVDRIVESPLNPRKHFDEAALAELAESLRTAGQLTPVIVRERVGLLNFELAAGHRRFRAAKLAGLTDLLAVVRQYDDETFLQVLTIENLQREDVHPIEEADAYRTMLERGGLDLPTLAAKVGKSVRYVRDRLALLRLISPLQTLFLEGHLLLGHALEIAKCPVAAQERMLDDYEVWRTVRRDEGVELALVSEDGDAEVLDDEDEADEPRTPTVEDKLARIRASKQIVTVGELREYIRDRVRLDPTDAHVLSLFPTVDPRAIASGVELTLEWWVDGDYPQVLNRNQYRAAAEGACEHAVLGLHTIGPARGQAQWVCTEKACATHWPQPKAATGRPVADDEDEDDDEAEPEWRRREREREAARAQLVPLLPFIREQMHAVLGIAPTDASGPIVRILAGSYIAGLDELSGAGCPFALTDAENVLRAWAWHRVEAELSASRYRVEEDLEALCGVLGLSPAKVLHAAKQAEKRARKAQPAEVGA